MLKCCKGGCVVCLLDIPEDNPMKTVGEQLQDLMPLCAEGNTKLAAWQKRFVLKLWHKTHGGKTCNTLNDNQLNTIKKLWEATR